jgi:hypothetical protein
VDAYVAKLKAEWIAAICRLRSILGRLSCDLGTKISSKTSAFGALHGQSAEIPMFMKIFVLKIIPLSLGKGESITWN